MFCLKISYNTVAIIDFVPFDDYPHRLNLAAADLTEPNLPPATLFWLQTCTNYINPNQIRERNHTHKIWKLKVEEIPPAKQRPPLKSSLLEILAQENRHFSFDLPTIFGCLLIKWTLQLESTSRSRASWWMKRNTNWRYGWVAINILDPCFLLLFYAHILISCLLLVLRILLGKNDLGRLRQVTTEELKVSY